MSALRKLPIWALALLVPGIAAAAVLVALSTTAAPGAGSATDATARADTIVIENFAYTPRTLEVTAGTTVTVRNVDGTAHTVTAKDGSFDTGDIDGGGTATITIDRPGTYRYFCDIHNYMTGTIVAR
jgi:plastocyanin